MATDLDPNNRALPTARATHEPSPDGLGHSVGVPNAEHTPGPWRVGADLTGICLERTDANGNATPEGCTRNGWAKTVAKVTHASWADIGEHVANAHLISASPELLRDCERLASLLEDHDLAGGPNGWVAQARQTIAKARGAS